MPEARTTLRLVILGQRPAFIGGPRINDPAFVLCELFARSCFLPDQLERQVGNLNEALHPG
jgi:hypothetical protein